MGLNELLYVADSENILDKNGYHLGHYIRDYRNVVHPAKEIRMSEEVSHENVVTMWAVLKRLISDLYGWHPWGWLHIRRRWDYQSVERTALWLRTAWSHPRKRVLGGGCMKSGCTTACPMMKTRSRTLLSISGISARRLLTLKGTALLVSSPMIMWIRV